MKAITLEELSRIWCDYKIPKDVRAEKEIEDLSFDTMEWQGWHKPECLMPDMEYGGDFVLAIIFHRKIWRHLQKRTGASCSERWIHEL